MNRHPFVAHAHKGSEHTPATNEVPQNDEIQPSEHCRNPTPLPDNSSPKLSSKVNHKKLENINLVQKLRQLSSTDDEAPATDNSASPCETRSLDRRYVSEILLASGLLMKDISWGPVGPMPIQLHPSGHPINPDLFLVLMLQARKLTARFHTGQDLLRELCSKIEQLTAKSSISDCCNDDSNLISGEDVLRQSEGWNEFSAEVPNVVLEIERSIFKDLIDEVVGGEGASSLQTKTSRQQRQLFAK